MEELANHDILEMPAPNGLPRPWCFWTKGGSTMDAGGDLRDRLSLDAVLTGVDALFYISPAFRDAAVEFGLRKKPA